MEGNIFNDTFKLNSHVSNAYAYSYSIVKPMYSSDHYRVHEGVVSPILQWTWDTGPLFATWTFPTGLSDVLRTRRENILKIPYTHGKWKNSGRSNTSTPSTLDHDDLELLIGVDRQSKNAFSFVGVKIWTNATTISTDPYQRASALVLSSTKSMIYQAPPFW